MLRAIDMCCVSLMRDTFCFGVFELIRLVFLRTNLFAAGLVALVLALQYSNTSVCLRVFGSECCSRVLFTPVCVRVSRVLGVHVPVVLTNSRTLSLVHLSYPLITQIRINYNNPNNP